jgi:hypothetical protein
MANDLQQLLHSIVPGNLPVTCSTLKKLTRDMRQTDSRSKITSHSSRNVTFLTSCLYFRPIRWNFVFHVIRNKCYADEERLEITY